MNLHAQFMPAQNSADCRLLISATNGEYNVATIASISIDDPNLQVRLRDIMQAYRMGIRFGAE